MENSVEIVSGYQLKNKWKLDPVMNWVSFYIHEGDVYIAWTPNGNVFVVKWMDDILIKHEGRVKSLVEADEMSILYLWAIQGMKRLDDGKSAFMAGYRRGYNPNDDDCGYPDIVKEWEAYRDRGPTDTDNT